MSDSNERNVNLQGYLNSSASSSNYIGALDRQLFNNGKKRSPDRAKLYVQTVNQNGQPFLYTMNGFEIVGIVLIINPSSVSVNASKIINRTQTMTGWIEDHWGEEMDTITFSGSTAAFIWHGPNNSVPTNVRAPLKQTTQEIIDSYNKYQDIQDLGIVAPQGLGQQSGLAVEQRRSTASYQELKYLIQLMNGNGAIFDDHGLVSDRLYIQISYDYAEYRGYFESFDITETAESPFKFTYTITFKSEKTMYKFLR